MEAVKKFGKKALKKLTHAKDKSPANAEKYDIVIGGSNIGAVLSSNINHFTHGHSTMFVATKEPETQMNAARVLFERTELKVLDYNYKTTAIVDSAAQNS